MPHPNRKYGRRRPNPAHFAKAIKFADISTGVVPAHPASEDYIQALRGGWKVLGNDRFGDCNAVTWANTRRLVTATLASESYPPLAQVVQFYKTQNPDFDPDGSADGNGPESNADGGMDIQTGLEYLHRNGGPDGVKPVAFAKVDVTNAEEVKAALAIFGSLWIGVLVLDANMNEFDQGKEWSLVPNSQIDGGHAVMLGGYDPDFDFVTWGTETAFAPSFWNGSSQGYKLVEEAWVVIWPEHLGSRAFQQGVDVQALADAYQKLTGDALDIPTPAPTPAPSPQPTPDPAPAPQPEPVDADAELAAVADGWVAKRHSGCNRTMQRALQAWLEAKNL